MYNPTKKSAFITRLKSRAFCAERKVKETAMATAYLYNRKKPILFVEIDNGVVTEIKEVIKENKHLLPVAFYRDGSLTLEALNKWLDTRKISDKRDGIHEARLMFHGFENYRNMFSLTDQYWFRYSRKESWDSMNFFTNHYDQEQGKIFFMPWDADPDRAINIQGPDLTTTGVLRKRWIQKEDKKSYLIKAGSVKYHQEPLSEVMASITLAKVGIISYVEYKLIVYGMRFCSICQNFVNDHTEFVPASHVYNFEPRKEKEEIYDHFIAMCREFRIPGAPDYMQNMVAVDHIICNNDRHLGNFGFIRDATTGEILGFAPLFDFGRAYWGANYAQDVSSRYFGKMENSCFKKVVKQLDVDALIDTEDMQKMVEKYPELTEVQVENINSKIIRVNKEMARIKTPKKEMELE